MSFIVGLTGPTGAGKSSVYTIACALGFKVVDCDLLARKAVEKGSLALKELVSVFGEDILDADGTLNRKALAKKAFCCEEKTELLNKTLLPYIVKLVEKELDATLVLLDAPTLYESGIDSICDTTVAVLSKREKRKERILLRDCIDDLDAELRINAGKSDNFYRERAEYIVNNDSSLPEFEEEMCELLKKIIGGI